MSINNEIIYNLLRVEHEHIAKQLGFINKIPININNIMLYKAIGLIDNLSKSKDDAKSYNIAITLSAILWNYRKPEWIGLKDFLILVLSRMGYAPSAIMIDNNYDQEEKKHSYLNSLFTELLVSLHQLKNEIIIGNKKYLLTEYQKNICDEIDNNKIIGISAPTSAGKSFVILLKSIDLILKKPGTIVYIVPTLSLVSQVSLDYRKILNNFGLTMYDILNSYYQDYGDNKKIFVLTQEKAIAAFSQKERPFTGVRLLVIDEIQNIERVAEEAEERAKILYDTLIEFRYQEEIEKIIVSGPRVEKIDNLAIKIFGEDAKEKETKNSPVVNFTYSVQKSGNSYLFNQYSTLTKKHQYIKIDNNINSIQGIGKTMYDEKYHNYLRYILNTLGNDSINIIFSPTAKQARKTAEAICGIYENAKDDKLNSLIDYVSQTVHPCYSLCKTLENGIAYHHGKLPHHIRRVLERAISEKLINNLVCTTTLMQGVNLPAQNIIIRNPNLFVKRVHGEPKLTSYEIANLRGRAGRLLKDFIGRSFIMDENSFEIVEEKQQALFEETTKELDAGYQDKYKKFKNEIMTSLIENDTPNKDNKEYSYLLPYIRQMIIRHGDKARERLGAVGIEMNNSVFSEIRKSISNLKVPKEVCMKNRYWDPLDLEKIYLSRNKPIIPMSINEERIPNKIMNAIKYMRNEMPIYYDKYFRENDARDNMLLSMCISAEKWLKEKPLAKILNTTYYDNSDKIEEAISTLQNKVSFGIPILLKPLYDMRSNENMFLNYIEMGAYNPITRKLIEMGVPRETAIYLKNKYFKRFSQSDTTENEKIIRTTLKLYRNELAYWVAVQIESLL